ncbi:hypothetical protein ZIOFF_056073 [Zingiber officinale]|uniref:Coiled-coil domain-containing protein n=1 Tax=Zingiber officinale TaxID=94328 RepID=A0A8J5KF49_ZINOF|nr:hypothetical protein ZIOFF_056073 [Zingiber officinale]
MAFEEEELPKLKEDKPGLGLTFNQYRDMIWKLWKKSPLNQPGEPPSPPRYAASITSSSFKPSTEDLTYFRFQSAVRVLSFDLSLPCLDPSTSLCRLENPIEAVMTTSKGYSFASFASVITDFYRYPSGSVIHRFYRYPLELALSHGLPVSFTASVAFSVANIRNSF